MQTIKSYLLSPRLWLSIAIFAASLTTWLLIRRLIRGFLAKQGIHGKKETNIRFGAMVIKYLIALFAVITILQMNGINVTSLVTGLGIAGIIIGFALQDILKDLIMGTNIVWDQFFAVGDVVQYGAIVGKVVYFNIKVTKIADVNTGNLLTVSNRNISEIVLVSDWLDIDIPASYAESAERMRGVCEAICIAFERIPDVSSCTFLGTDAFADSLISYRVRLHCPPEQKNPVRRQALGIIQDIYAENGLSVPYPQLDVHQKPFEQ